MEVVRLQKALNRAVLAIKKGEVIICPTDTVYGFLADASNKKAVDKIYKIKKRPKLKPLPFFVRDFKMAKELAEINKKQEKILKKYWPGKFTFVLKRKPCEVGSHTKLYGVYEKTIALRIPKYKFLNDLLKRINRPIVQTSVNISGQASLIKIKEIIAKFENQRSKPDLIINDGDLKKRKSSKIIDLTGDSRKILRY